MNWRNILSKVGKTLSWIGKAILILVLTEVFIMIIGLIQLVVTCLK